MAKLAPSSYCARRHAGLWLGGAFSMAGEHALQIERVDVPGGRTSEAVLLFLAQEYRAGSDGLNERRLPGVLQSARGSRLAVLSEMERDAAMASRELLRRTAQENDQFIVVPWGIGSYDGRIENLVAVYSPDGKEVLQAKISLSAEDVKHGTVAGHSLKVYRTNDLRFAVLNCHDYTHADLLRELVEEKLDVVVVTSANTATQMFAEYAKADVHRLFSFVVICNVAEFGGSGVFAPFHLRKVQEGEKGLIPGNLTMGGVQYHAIGRARAQVDIPLEIQALQKMRDRFPSHPNNPKEIREDDDLFEAIAPPETVTFAQPPYRATVAGLEGPASDTSSWLETIVVENDRRPEARQNTNEWRVGVAQLESASIQAYLESGYVPSTTAEGPKLARRVRSLLEQSSSEEAKHDLLIFPEVFLPIHAEEGGETLETRVQRFVDEIGTIVVSGIEYDKNANHSNDSENRVRVYLPNRLPATFTKLTRSQYDARGKGEGIGKLGEVLPMRRGHKLLRVDVAGELSFGVLTCFDYSHLELVHAINIARRLTRADTRIPSPPDLLIVPCFNPFGALYTEMARADAHRYYQFVAVCNVAQHGESGIYGPLKTKPERRTLIHAGARIDAVLPATLEVGRLRKHRDEMSDACIELARKEPTVDSSGNKLALFHRKPGLLSVGPRRRGR
jgi:predicted amidohydrolase